MSIFSDSPRPSGGLELWSWIFMRLSGIALLFLALGHLYIMHLANGIDVIDYQFVAIRYKSMLWRSYDFVMVFLAMLHGLNGARIIVDDYIQKEPVRKIVLSLFFFAGGIFILMGFWVIIFFPSAGM